MGKWLLALGALNIFNLFYTGNLFYSRQVVLVNLCCLALVWIVSEIVHPERVKTLLWVVIASCTVVCIEGVAQYLGKGILLPWQTSRAVIATIGNTNYVGAYLLFGIFACLSLSPQRLFFILPSLLLALGVLVLSRARASWAGCTVGMVVWLWMTLPKRWFGTVMACAVLAGAVTWTVVPESALGGFRDGKTLGYRLKYWAAAVELWKDSPLIGIGFDGYRSRVYEAQARINDRQKDFFANYVDPKPRRVHNEYLQALVDGGVLYFLTYFGFIVWVLSHSYRAARTNPTIRGIWCAQISVLTAALFFFTFRLVDTVSLFHINLGVLCGISQSSLLQSSSTSKA